MDFFELDSVYLELSKRKLSKYSVKFHCEDSIAYIEKTEKKYSFIVSDSPFGGDFYDEDGLPYFLEGMIAHATRDSVLIFNYVNKYLPNQRLIEQKVNTIRKAEEIFMVVRNEKMTYIVVAFKDGSREGE